MLLLNYVFNRLICGEYWNSVLFLHIYNLRSAFWFNDIYYLVMSFIGIEFTNDNGGGIALVSSQWLTPRKQEVFWPPYKSQSQYDKAIKNGVVPEQDGSWTIYKIKRSFFETDDYSKVQSKIKQAQITSDCQSKIDDILPLKRRIQKPRRFLNDSSSDDEDEALSQKLEFPLPPKIARINKKSNETLLPSLSQTFKRAQQIATPYTLNNNNLEISYSNIRPDTIHNCKSSFDNTPTISTVVETNSQDGVYCHSTVIKKILSLLVHIREQNNEILTIFNNKQETTTTLSQFRLEDLPVNLPISTQADLDILETYLKHNQNLCTMVNIC